jgi:hypothetical protein
MCRKITKVARKVMLLFVIIFTGYIKIVVAENAVSSIIPTILGIPSERELFSYD